MRRNLLFYIFVMVFLVAIVIFWSNKKSGSQVMVSSFEECVAKGFKVMESYPRQCSLPDGRFFVETMVENR